MEVLKELKEAVEAFGPKPWAALTLFVVGATLGAGGARLLEEEQLGVYKQKAEAFDKALTTEALGELTNAQLRLRVDNVVRGIRALVSEMQQRMYRRAEDLRATEAGLGEDAGVTSADVQAAKEAWFREGKLTEAWFIDEWNRRFKAEVIALRDEMRSRVPASSRDPRFVRPLDEDAEPRTAAYASLAATNLEIAAKRLPVK